jgi:hypothetical protein
MAKATNISPIRNTQEPFITFQASPDIAAEFQKFGMLFRDHMHEDIWVLYPKIREFEKVLKYIEEYEK